MKIIRTQKYAKTKSPKMDILKKNKISLTEEERKEVMDKGVVWHHGPKGEETPAVWKSDIDGEIWYTCNTHRAYQSKPTLKGAINAYDFIETTSQTKEKIVLAQNKEKELIEELSDLEHNQWSHWTKYMLNNLTEDNIKRWERQIKTDYKDLNKKEKDSDREWAEKVLKIVNKYMEDK